MFLVACVLKLEGPTIGVTTVKNVGASVLDRLKSHSRAAGIAMPTLLRRYVQERLLYRLSVSEDAERFCLKGGVLMAAYNDGNLLRPTEDIDFSGYDGDGDVGKLEATLRTVFAIEVPDDGVVFDPGTMRILKDRQGIVPGGKVSLLAFVGTARVDLKVDVGFGNAITPDAALKEIPTLLDGVVPRPVVLAYPLETVVAEKAHAMVQFGRLNTRIKDHFDILMLSRKYGFDGTLLSEAIANTFRHQCRPIPESIACLDQRFAADNEKAWSAFVAKVSPGLGTTLAEAVEEIRCFLEPAIAAARDGSAAPEGYEPHTGWSMVGPRP